MRTPRRGSGRWSGRAVARSSARTASVGFDDESGEQALEQVARAADDGSVYIDSTAGAERMQQLFASGKMAMNIAGPYTPEYVDAGVNYGVAELPSFTDEHTTIAGPDTWAVFDNGDERVNAAIEFLNWFSEPEPAGALDRQGQRPAADHRHLEGQGLQAVRGSLPELDKFIANLKLAQTRPTIPEYPQIWAMGEDDRVGPVPEAEPAEAAAAGGRYRQRRTAGTGAVSRGGGLS